MKTKMIALGVAFAVTLTACGATIGEGDGQERDVILRFDAEGGFAPQDWILARGPIYTLTGDGRLIHEGPVIAIYPGPLLPNYQVTTVSQGEIDQIVDLIERMGLPEITEQIDDSALQFITDATTEIVTYFDESGAHRYGAYGLGFDENPENETTRMLLELRTILDRLATSGVSEPYIGDQVRIIAGEGLVDEEFVDVRDWPLDDAFEGWQALQDEWKCKTFPVEVLETFANASQVTLWRSPQPDDGPAEIKLLVRPLLPGEDACPAEVPPGA